MSSGRGVLRRTLLISGWAGARALAQRGRGAVFPSDAHRYSDPATELDVFRLTDPSYTAVLPAFYNRAMAKNSNWLLFSCDRLGSLQVFRMDLKDAQTRQLTEVEDLDPASVTLTPDNRSFCFFAGRSLYIGAVSPFRYRELYRVPSGWTRTPGLSVGPDGTHATFCEARAAASRLRMVSLNQGLARTVIEAAFPMSHPIPRPLRAQILYRQGDEALWLVNSD